MKATRSGILIMLLVLFCAACWARPQVEVSEKRVYRLSDKQINTALAKQFPITKSREGFNVSLMEPTVIFNALDKTLEVTSRTHISKGDMELFGEVSIAGDVEYDEIFGYLQFTNTHIDNVKVQRSTFTEPQHARALALTQQTVGANLPDLRLFDFTTLDIEYMLQKPTSIEINPKSLMIYF